MNYNFRRRRKKSDPDAEESSTSNAHTNDESSNSPPKKQSKKKQKRKLAEVAETDVPLGDAITPSPKTRRRARSKATKNKEESDENTNEKTDDKESDQEEKAPTEKRLFNWKKSCPKSTEDRIKRAVTQRLFMISATEKSETQREYAVLGSTGNVYTVGISHVNSCNCPDSVRGNLCKHVLFVLLKVLKIKSNSPYLYQRALLTSELKEIFSKAPKTSIGVLADEKVLKKYREQMGEEKPEPEAANEGVTRKECKGDDCPVCMEELDESKEALLWCKAQCGQNIHKECFTIWAKQSSTRGDPVSCVYCRAAWLGDAVNQPKIGKGGYLNLGAQ